MKHKIIKGTVTIDGILYKAFEMWSGGLWKIVQGDKHSDYTVFDRIPAKSAKNAIEQWLKNRS